MTETHTLTGTILEIGLPVEINANFTKADLVVTTQEDTPYPQPIVIQCANTKIDLLKDLSVGVKVKVSYNLRGKQSNGRYFNTLEMWKIEKL